MLATSKISVVNKHEPTIEIWIYEQSKSDRRKFSWKKYNETNYSVKKDDLLGIISCHIYVESIKFGKYFYTVINKKNEVFFMDESDLIIPLDYEPNQIKLTTFTIVPKYSDYIESTSPLDL